jgi:hypothetical protein
MTNWNSGLVRLAMEKMLLGEGNACQVLFTSTTGKRQE